MQKGKFGFRLWVYPVAAILLVIFDQSLAATLVVAFGIAAEKNDWVSHQLLQVFFFGIFAAVKDVIVRIVNWAFSGLYSIPYLGTAMNVVADVIEAGLSITLLVFLIIALVRVVKGQDAKLPGAAAIANHAFGIAPVKPQYPQAPQAPQNPQAPYQPQAYQPQAPQQPQQPRQ